MGNNFTDDTLSQTTALGHIATWTPARPVGDLTQQNTNVEIDAVKSGLAHVVSSINSSSSATASGTPSPCTGVAAVESPYKTVDGSMKSLVSVSFVNTDVNFGSADIYLTGYHGSTTPQKVTSGTTSPISFLCETTQEPVTVMVVAVGNDGSYLPIISAPTTTVVLDGVTSAPPAPSIATGLVLSPLGYSFSFNVEGGLLHDVIDGYRIYRHTTNVYSGSTQIQYLKQPTDNSGTIQVQDTQPLSSTIDYFYWVSAVNTSGLESTPTAVGAAIQGGFPQQVTGVSATESPYKTASGQMLSLVAVNFTPAVGDSYYNEVQVFFTGFNGNALPQLMAEGTTSPVQFLCETTHEVVTVTVVAVSANGISADFSSAPTTTVTLDGVNSAPPAPSIAQAQVALAHDTGWQFAFNIIGGLEHDLIQGYRVYHSTTNSAPTPPASQYQYYAQPTTNLGTIVVQEVTQNITYYWVSSVNIAGLESTLTAVPFVYTDPGNPSPPTPSPVVTTLSFRPATYLNGWGSNAHNGNYESGGGLGSEVWGLNAATTLAYSNPNSAYDGNEGSCASLAESHTHQYGGCIWSFSAFPGLASGASVTGAVLSVLSETKPTSGYAGHCDIWYSLNNGSTWTKLYGTYSTRFKQYDTVTLSTGQDMTKVQVMAFMDSHDDCQHLVYEVRIDITQSSYPGPEKVTGAGATLASGNVQVTFNGLTPLSRTDVTNYYVYRAPQGGGYSQSHLHATITPTGAATYSWTDTTAHDSTVNYWVIAQNSTGYSAPSDPAALTNASSAIYTSGNTIESLQPLEPGSDVTNAHILTSSIPASATGVGQTTGGVLTPLPSSVLATGFVNTNGTTTVAWASLGTSFTTGSSWNGKRIIIGVIGGATYVRTIVSVSSFSVLTVNASIPTGSSVNYWVYNDLGWSLTASGTSDVYNINVGAALYVPAGLPDFTMGISIDGGSAVQTAVYASVGSSGIPYFASVTGLSAGAHTIVVVSGVSSGGPTATANALIQRIY